MGDRANVLVKYNGEQVCLYTHWSGSDLPEILRNALVKGSDRIEDFQYITRIIFQAMIGDDKSNTGFGISQNIHDGDRAVIIFDVESQNITIKEKEFSVIEFVESDFEF